MRKFDWPLVAAALFLFVLGITILISVAPEMVRDQLIFVVFSSCLFVIFLRTDYRSFNSLAFWAYLTSLGLLFLTAAIGSESRGAARWFTLGPWQIQASEIIKPFLILAFASWFAKPRYWHILLIAFPAVLIFKQPDLGSSLIVLASGIGQLFASGLPVAFILAGSAVFTISTPVLWHFLHGYQKQRLITFINPQIDPLKTGYNAIQAMITVGSGQLLGRALGHGTQSQLKFLPERLTDFIFASLAEELGLAGSFIVLALYTLLLWRILTIARHAPDKFGYLICLGVFSSIFTQVFINIGMNIGLMPVTGVTLPLLSSGGSSLLATLISLGLVESVALRAKM